MTRAASGCWWGRLLPNASADRRQQRSSTVSRAQQLRVMQDADEDPEAMLARQYQGSFQLLVGAGVHPSLAAALASPAQDATGARQAVLAPA